MTLKQLTITEITLLTFGLTQNAVNDLGRDCGPALEGASIKSLDGFRAKLNRVLDIIEESHPDISEA